jgi:hypothetical protein
MPKFILLLHEGPNAFPADISPDQIQAIIQRYVEWRKKVQHNGRKVEGHKLTDGEGRVMKASAGSARVTDGPYAEAREVIGGLFIVEAQNYEEVVELSKDCPHLDFGTIEIREVQPT